MARQLTDSIVMWLQGGLGNQLFQLNAAMNLAAVHGNDFRLSRSSFVRDRLRSAALWPLVPKEAFLPVAREVALGFPYDRAGRLKASTLAPALPIVQRYDEARPGTFLVGFFQDQVSTRAGTEAVAAILRDRAGGLDPALRDRVSGRPAIHVRRGDYVTSSAARATFGTLGKPYYLGAMELLGVAADDCVYFTDEPEQVCAEFGVPRSAVLGPDDTASDLEAMLAMSLASHLIIPNSSFSWWAATAMGRTDAVVAPERWFLDQPAEEWPRDPRWKAMSN